MEEDILYTPEEIAKKLQLTKGTVYEMIKRGELDAHRIGRYIRISKNQFELYLLKSKGYENIYEGNIKVDGDETLAILDDVGVENKDSVRIYVNTHHEGRVKLSIRPENIILSKDMFISSARNVYKGEVKEIVDTDSKILVVIDIGVTINAYITKRSLDELKIQKNREIYVVFKAMSVTVYK